MTRAVVFIRLVRRSCELGVFLFVSLVVFFSLFIFVFTVFRLVFSVVC